MGGGAHHGAHGHQGIGAWTRGDGWKEAVENVSEKSACHGPHEQGWGEYASRTAGTQGDGGNEYLNENKGKEQDERHVPLQGFIHGFVPHTENLGERETVNTDYDSSQGGFNIIGALEGIEFIFQGV